MTTETDKNRLAQSQLKTYGFDPGPIDGVWGARSQAAASAWLASLDPPSQEPQAPATPESPATGTFDSRTEANIATLIPRAQEAARRFMAAAVPAMAAYGLLVRITSGRRTYAEQDALYAQGRTAPGPKVTNAPSGYGWHNFGACFDFTLFDVSGRPIWDSPHYRECAEIARSQGMDAGAFWATFPDEPHIQLPYLPALARARALHDEGKEVS